MFFFQPHKHPLKSSKKSFSIYLKSPFSRTISIELLHPHNERNKFSCLSAVPLRSFWAIENCTIEQLKMAAARKEVERVERNWKSIVMLLFNKESWRRFRDERKKLKFASFLFSCDKRFFLKTWAENNEKCERYR